MPTENDLGIFYLLTEADPEDIGRIISNTDDSWQEEPREHLKRRWASYADNFIKLVDEDPDEYRGGREQWEKRLRMTFAGYVALEEAMQIIYPEDEDFQWATRAVDNP